MKKNENKKKKKQLIYSQKSFFIKFFLFWYWFFKDLKKRKENPALFTEFGLTMFCGRQGAGKTTAMIEYLERMRLKYPKAMIITNFGYKHETQAFDSWNDLLNIRNGDYGVIFAIDEIQNEFSTNASRNFPESLLSEITQQRKQRIKIIATSQVYTRVAKPLREQTYDVCECRTLLGRWTFVKCYDAEEYNELIDTTSIDKKMKIRRKKRWNFIQDDKLRDLFDSYAKVERIKSLDYVRREDNGAIR